MKQKPTKGKSKLALYLKNLEENAVFRKEIEVIKNLPSAEERLARAQSLAEQYDIPYVLGSRLFNLVHMTGTKLKDVEASELCIVNTDLYDFLFRHPNQEPKQRERRYKSYPVSISISPLASKRDLLDFIAKRWDEINEAMFVSRARKDNGQGAPRIRKKTKKQRNDLIWRMRSKPISEIVKKVNTKFDVNLIPADIHKMLSIERKRRDDI